VSAAASQPVRVGLLSFAHTHAETYAALLRQRDDVQLVTCDPGPHPAGELRGRAAADAWGVEHVASVSELLARGLDAVVVASENARHRELVELALDAGCHVLCEKPLATSREDAAAMRAAVQRSGRFLMVAYPVRFSSAFGQLRDHAAGGALGQLLSVRGTNNGKLPTSRSWFTDPALAGGGALVDHVVHLADLLDVLTGGAQALTVSAVGNSLLHPGAAAETAGLVTITYPGGLVAAIDCSWSVPESAPTWGGLALTAAGTGGAVSADVFGSAVRGLRTASGLPVELPYGPDLDEAMLEAFLDGVRSGRAPQPDLEVGARTLSVVLAAQESFRTGTTVAVQPV
jgi:1,5-anhydro-D-fructose reductase (1,5-anhydro-D-mannitol-forming)